MSKICVFSVEVIYLQNLQTTMALIHRNQSKVKNEIAPELS